ncbi:alanine racemase [Asanoa sp. NPDC049573]|uniref:alanine racemase n=1 Tax=Asanoa sp. NPDC049573 TaxID=3155396 RepID=UPI003425E0AD
MLPTPLDALPTPALLVDVDRLERNIAAMAGAFAAAGVALRPHVKTSKCWEVARRQLEAGAIGFTCSTAAEVAWLRGHGVADLLWAHIPIGPRKVAFVVDTIAQHSVSPGSAEAAGSVAGSRSAEAAASVTGSPSAGATRSLTVSLDSVEAARPLSAAASAAGVTVPFVLEVNTGHARLGVDPEDAVATAAGIAALPGLRLRGVLTHEGHISALPDRPSLEEGGRTAGGLLVEVASALRTAGHDAEIVSVGSTPGATSTPFVPGVTEGRPGTYVYYDGNQMRMGSCGPDQCAQTVLARVASVRRAGRPIIDAGVKAMSSDAIAAAGGVGLVVDRPGITFVEANEEHGFLIDEGVVPLAVGDLVRLVPNHACGTTNMWSHLYAVRGDQAVERWEISARY